MFCYQLVTDNELRNIFTFPGKVFSACTLAGYVQESQLNCVHVVPYKKFPV